MAGCRCGEELRERLLERIERLKRRPPIHPLAITAVILLGYALASSSAGGPPTPPREEWLLLRARGGRPRRVV